MIGHVESYDEERLTGVIKCEEKFYEFHIDEWNLDSSPMAGNAVDFMPEDDGSATNVSSVGEFIHDMTPVKNHYIAGIIGVIIGFTGMHRLYLGYYRIAFLQILVTGVTMGYGAVWGIIDGFLILSGHINKDGKGRLLK